jgi:hypothetical protein
MFKKILSILLIAILAISCSAGTVSAKQYDYYWTFHTGDKYG